MKAQIDNRLFFEQIEAMLAEGDQVQIRMKGHSMRPLLRNERDTAVLTPCRDEELHTGDIVLFRCGDRHLLHRIIRCGGDSFTLAGDGNYRLTEHCSRRDIVAVLTHAIRPSGRIIDCRSRRWRMQSRLWLSLPPSLRKQLLRVMWHLGCLVLKKRYRFSQR